MGEFWLAGIFVTPDFLVRDADPIPGLFGDMPERAFTNATTDIGHAFIGKSC